MDSVSEVLTQLGFRQTFDIQGQTNLSDFLKSQARWGIYILHFRDGSYYVGQSVDVDQRFRQHRLYWTEPIVRLSYKRVQLYELNAEEAIAIEAFRTLRKSLPKAKQFRLRNIKGNEYQRGQADFDFVMAPDKQDEWLANTSIIDIHGVRSEFPDLRAQYAEKFQHKFMKKPFASDVLEVTSAYVRNTIPAVLQTEAVFWGASCLPKSVVYCRINVNWQEVYSAFGKESLFFSFHMAFEPTGLPAGVMRFFESFGDVGINAENLFTIETPVENEDETEQVYEELGFTRQYRKKLVNDLRTFFDRFPTASITNHYYKPGGYDQIQLVVLGKEDALALIKDPNFCRAMRTMNLRLMRLGPSMWAANHCMDLADHCRLL